MRGIEGGVVGLVLVERSCWRVDSRRWLRKRGGHVGWMWNDCSKGNSVGLLLLLTRRDLQARHEMRTWCGGVKSSVECQVKTKSGRVPTRRSQVLLESGRGEECDSRSARREAGEGDRGQCDW